MKCPPILNTIIFADDARLAAQLSCVLAVPNTYLPVCDGPRLQRPDASTEISRRHNAAARAKSKSAYMVGLNDVSFDALKGSLQGHRPVPCHRISQASEIQDITGSIRKRSGTKVVWGKERIGLGLLKALQTGADLVFEDKPCPSACIPGKGDHLVVCEEGEELAQVIAANYAFALNAGLIVIPEVDQETAEALLEEFYNMHGADLLGLRQRHENFCDTSFRNFAVHSRFRREDLSHS